MSTTILDAADTAGSAIEEAVAVFMLHPETFGQSVAAGYQNPFAGYVAGRGGVLGEATGATVASVFAVFEPGWLAAMWDEGVAVRGAVAASQLYWDQAAAFARKYLSAAEGLDRLAALGERVIAATATSSLPLFTGWRAMPLAEDSAARALQVMFVLRELRGGVHFNLLALSGITPVEAHMLNKGPQYTAIFGWPEPYADGAHKKDRYDEIRQETNRRIAELFGAALDPAEADELARLSASALATLKANVPS
ncbi:evbL [Mycolicibacterium goodii]|uniref:SCO6745 family protein n=1 Tax=Mycolicibacterium goodii TaxID=134601 RepID=UPI000C26AEB6|nr:evbL [Mycolicibacterium goodii]MBU8807447.1 evbL [Mycolicibacterium goodii]PJK21312.1 evbL [Mycolicibacterium goodii]ULN47705.1 evbL [Mycolicibacterium goodii]